jgi:hypothetical protein
MTEDGFEEITIIERTSVKEIGDRIEVEWGLSAAPNLEWTEVFQLTSPSTRKGSVDWVEGGGPDVFGSAVRWIVPASELDDADDEVRLRLTVANKRVSKRLSD